MNVNSVAVDLRYLTLEDLEEVIQEVCKNLWHTRGFEIIPHGLKDRSDPLGRYGTVRVKLEPNSAFLAKLLPGTKAESA